MGNFTTFQKFSSVAAAAQLLQLLQDNNIEYEVVNNSFAVDITFGGNNQTEKEVKLLPADFEKVNLLLEEAAEKNIKSIDKNHYLFDFTDDELLEIIQKPDEWSKEDYLIAKNILQSKGKGFTPQQLNQLNRQRLQQLAEPEKDNTLWTIIGYIFSLMGGILGVFIGWHLITFKKILPNGQKVYVYTKQARLHGQIIFILGIICLMAWVIYKIKKT